MDKQDGSSQTQPYKDSLRTFPGWPWVLGIGSGLPGLGFLLAAVSSGWWGGPGNIVTGVLPTGWLSFTAGLGLNALLFWLAVAWLKRDGLPSWVAWLSLGAILLRLGLAVTWYLALPAVGYATPMQEAGYVMEDAFRRDTAAWELAKSSQPLLAALPGYRSVDQYGGLLFFSALIYRFLGGAVHQPLLLVVFTATASGMAVLLAWSFARRLFDESLALWVALGMAFYPEVVLLGSTQMREPFIILLVSLAAYGLARQRFQLGLSYLALPAGALLLLLPLSITMAGISVGLLLILSLGLASISRGNVQRNTFQQLFQKYASRWKIVAIGVVLVGVGAWLVASSPSGRQAWEGVTTWVRDVAQWQATLTYQASGWVQKVLRSTPGWFHTPFLLLYGITRPLLPAALAARSAGPGGLIWQGIAIWRSLGWTVVLAALAYAPLRLVLFPGERDQPRRLLFALVGIAWLTLFLTSFWGGADDWDNPRYRAAFSLFQLTLAAWALLQQWRSPEPWFWRMLISAGIFLFLVGLWYIQRYFPGFPWPVNDLFRTLALGVAVTVLYLVWDIARLSKGRPGKQEG